MSRDSLIHFPALGHRFIPSSEERMQSSPFWYHWAPQGFCSKNQWEEVLFRLFLCEWLGSSEMDRKYHFRSLLSLQRSESVTVVYTAIEWKSLDYLLGHWEYDLNLNTAEIPPILQKKERCCYLVVTHCLMKYYPTTVNATRAWQATKSSIDSGYNRNPSTSGGLLLERRHSLSCSWLVPQVFVYSVIG